jgi:hypothetical protein
MASPGDCTAATPATGAATAAVGPSAGAAGVGWRVGVFGTGAGAVAPGSWTAAVIGAATGTTAGSPAGASRVVGAMAVAESAATASAAGAGASPAPPRSPAEESTIIGSLVAEQVQQGDETTCGERPTQAELDLAAEIGPVVAGYNRSIVEEKLSRRERFRTERLVDARQRATGQTVDEQLDFLCEEDNCAVVFEDESGKLFWVLGHIEYMATTRSDVSLNRIAPRDLERLEKDHQVRVSIDDSRSIFLFKWYIEVDKDGKDLPGYQNKV